MGTHRSSEATLMRHIGTGLLLAAVAVCSCLRPRPDSLAIYFPVRRMSTDDMANAELSCLPPRPDSFAIYFPVRRMSTDDMANAELAELALQDEPILSAGDIISYTRATHEIELTPSAYDTIQRLEVPVSGLPFVVCAGRKAVYWGAFWTLASSVAFEGFVILQHPGESERRVIRIDFGYPSPGLPLDSEDPRADETLMNALERAGKLR